MKRNIFHLIFFALVVVLLSSCAKIQELIPTIDPWENMIQGSNGVGESAVDNKSGIVSFHYSYNGSIGGDSYSYSVKKENGKIIFTYESMQYPYGEMTGEIDSSVLAALEEMYRDLRLAEWDGFSKYDTGVLDGSGFGFSMDFSDGGTISASGSNCFPPRYGDFHSRMESILAPIADQVREHARQSIIASGIHGDLCYWFVNFKQHGTSGKDHFEFVVYREEDRENNFDVQIESESGAVFPKGSVRYLTNLDDSFIDFEGVRALIEKYDLISWYGYEETAEDYNNAEWFQICFAFEDGDEEFYLDAMGTEHPENYDAFRAEFLQLMADMIHRADESGVLTPYE